MEIEEIRKIKNSFYSLENLQKILNTIYFRENNFDVYREFAILSYNKKGDRKREDINFNDKKLRAITFKNASYLYKTLQLNYFYENENNLYCSVARIKQLPNFPFSSERTLLTKPFYEKEYKNYIVHYDLYLDFDIYNENEIKNKRQKPKLIQDRIINFITEINNIIFDLLRFKLKCEVVFSGNRGFKILIYNDILNFEEIIKIHHLIKKKYNCQFLDLSGSFIPSKLMKLNNTLLFKDNKINLVMPLHETNYKSFFEIILKNKNFDVFSYEYLQNPTLYNLFIKPNYEDFNLNFKRYIEYLENKK